MRKLSRLAVVLFVLLGFVFVKHEDVIDDTAESSEACKGFIHSAIIMIRYG